MAFSTDKPIRVEAGFDLPPRVSTHVKEKINLRNAFLQTRAIRLTRGTRKNFPTSKPPSTIFEFHVLEIARGSRDPTERDLTRIVILLFLALSRFKRLKAVRKVLHWFPRLLGSSRFAWFTMYPSVVP